MIKDITTIIVIIDAADNGNGTQSVIIWHSHAGAWERVERIYDIKIRVQVANLNPPKF